MRIRNFTPDPLTVYDARSDYSSSTFPSEGIIRAAEATVDAGRYALDGCVTADEQVALAMQGQSCILAQFTTLEYAGVEDMPPIFAIEDGPGALMPGDVLVLSIVAAQALAQAARPWDEKHPTQLAFLTAAGVVVATPDTGPTGVMRDEEGRIVGTKRLVLTDADGGPALVERLAREREREVGEIVEKRKEEIEKRRRETEERKAGGA